MCLGSLHNGEVYQLELENAAGRMLNLSQYIF
ncbi:hypothetical protein RvY_15298 [Ramazzottius varieornatus]|uniref:Uncharacterized protein n=1 Tax=Ramazzottius varieornatus TaxID=947166 RepID=A0A1D1VUE3_RAMVA|nr:hypothetical protein RvY_15298 [Ramazzottius varieornatus]